MKSIFVAFFCILYCCQAAVVSDVRNAVVIDGKNEPLPDVTEITATTIKDIPVGPTGIPSTTQAPNSTTLSPTTPKTTTVTTTTKPSPTTPSTTTVTPSTPTTKPTSTPNTSTITPSSTTTIKTTTSPTAAPVTSTTVTPPGNRGFDGPSFIGGIVLASGLMAIGFVALKFYRARTELNYHTL